MSKRSRRRRRQAREREVVRITPLTLSTVSNFLLAMKLASEMMAMALNKVASQFSAFNVYLTATDTQWPAAVADAIVRRDSLPLLVYADWCQENGREEAERLARRLAAEFAGRS